MPDSALVYGDFNTAAESAEYRRLLETTGLVDCRSLLDPANLGTSTRRNKGGEYEKSILFR